MIFFVFELQQAACSSYQNTIGRHSTIGPYSHLSGNPYTANGCNNDFSYTNQYGYNSWGMWRDSRNLTPSSTYSSKSRSSIKSFTIILMTAAFIVILAVLSVAALAFYFSTFKSDDCKFQATRLSHKYIYSFPLSFVSYINLYFFLSLSSHLILAKSHEPYFLIAKAKPNQTCSNTFHIYAIFSGFLHLFSDYDFRWKIPSDSWRCIYDWLKI